MTTRAIDSHVHFWKVSEHDWYPALKPFAEAVGSDTLNSDFSPADYRRDAVGLDVEAFVHVSATTAPGAYLKEASWIDELAESEGLDLVMIGTIAPESGPEEIRADLEAQARSDRFAGARVFPGLAPDAPAVQPLLDWLNATGRIFDLVVDPTTAQAWGQLLDQYPDLKVAVEHSGSPNPAEEDAFTAWQAGMRELAARPGTMCKLTGLGMMTMDLGEQTLRPWMQETIGIFGWERVMFGSNVPIETMAGPYAQWIDTVAAVVSEGSEAECERFYRGNARAFYW